MPDHSHRIRDVIATIHELADGPLKIQMEQVLRAYDAKAATIAEEPPISNSVTPAEEDLRQWLYDFEPGGDHSPLPVNACAKIAAKARDVFGVQATKDTTIIHSIAKALEVVSDPGESLVETVNRLVAQCLSAVAELQDVCEALDLQNGELAPEKVEWIWGRLAEAKAERDEARETAEADGFARGIKYAAGAAEHAIDPISAYGLLNPP